VTLAGKAQLKPLVSYGDPYDDDDEKAGEADDRSTPSNKVRIYHQLKMNE
jgi:hypothetical protein